MRGAIHDRKSVDLTVAKPDELVCRMHGTGGVESGVDDGPLIGFPPHFRGEYPGDVKLATRYRRHRDPKIGVVDVRRILLE